MKTKKLLIAMACGLAMMPALQAEEAAAGAPAQVQQHPYLSDALYPAWSQLTPERGVVDVRLALGKAKAALEAICRVKPEEATYENVFAAYEMMGEDLDRAESLLAHLGSVMDSPALREAQETLLPELTEFSSGVTSNEQLWNVVKNAAAQPWVKQLDAEHQRFVQQVVDGFRDSGADLPADKKARKMEIQKEMTMLRHDFSKRVLDSTNAWKWVVTDKAELAGLSDSWLERAAGAALAAGYGSKENPQWLITLDFSSCGDVLRDCTVEATRRKVWEARDRIGCGGETDTADIVARIMVLRQELAELLGFGNYCDLMTARRMVRNSANAVAFVDGMMQRLKPAFDKECADFLAFVSRCKGETVTKLNPWDRFFYSRKMAKELYDFDPETLRPYLPMEQVIDGMFRIFSHLYDVTYTELPTVCLQPGETCPEGKIEVWHPQVKLYKVVDNKTGAHLGSFYTDLYPRASKRAGAWVMSMRYGTPATENRPHEPHLATLCGNLTAPTADKPALLTHYDVETIFHEFGHMMHCMLADSKVLSHMGTHVAWDFVELPSQLNENWTWEPEGLKLIAKHYESGEALPEELMRKMLAARYFMPATDNMGQLCLAKLDLEMHTNYAASFAGKDLDAATSELLRPWRIPMTVDSHSIMRNLTHCINGGYAGGYYSYKWAEVLAADAFTRFKKEGVMNAATGAAYRKAVLSKGDSKPADEVYRDFMGRDPNPDALLQSQGLLPAE